MNHPNQYLFFHLIKCTWLRVNKCSFMINLYPIIKMLIKVFIKCWGVASKYSEVMFPYKHVIAFLRITETTYILPTLLSKSLRFFLKSINLKEFTTSPNSHSTDDLTALICALYACIWGVITPNLKGPCKYTLRG